MQLGGRSRRSTGRFLFSFGRRASRYRFRDASITAIADFLLLLRWRSSALSRLPPWQRHSKPGPAARAEAVVAPPRDQQAWMCAITTGHRVC